MKGVIGRDRLGASRKKTENREEKRGSQPTNQPTNQPTATNAGAAGAAAAPGLVHTVGQRADVHPVEQPGHDPQLRLGRRRSRGHLPHAAPPHLQPAGPRRRRRRRRRCCRRSATTATRTACASRAGPTSSATSRAPTTKRPRSTTVALPSFTEFFLVRVCLCVCACSFRWIFFHLI